MREMMSEFDLTLSNGETLRCWGYAGGNAFEYDGELGREKFAGGLREVVLKRAGSEESETLRNAVLDYCETREGVTYFSVRELGYEERKMEELRGNVEYIAMMTGVEL
ncbi:MAG: hypothetical protein IJR85_04850 [Synergistaceae bacterium]|nr:hypothetical protein [Synergistaceae bacterium]